jgi:hypothetical protein
MQTPAKLRGAKATMKLLGPRNDRVTLRVGDSARSRAQRLRNREQLRSQTRWAIWRWTARWKVGDGQELDDSLEESSRGG